MIKERGKKKMLVGVVVSDKMDKTVVVKVDSIVKQNSFLESTIQGASE